MLPLSLKQKDEPDAFKELGTGNRIATWLFYVSTLFIEGKTTVKVIFSSSNITNTHATVQNSK